MEASRGQIWFDALTSGKRSASNNEGPIRSADAPLGETTARFITVVPDPHNRFPRATDNVVGLEQGWLLARKARLMDAAKNCSACISRALPPSMPTRVRGLPDIR